MRVNIVSSAGAVGFDFFISEQVFGNFNFDGINGILVSLISLIAFLFVFDTFPNFSLYGVNATGAMLNSINFLSTISETYLRFWIICGTIICVSISIFASEFPVVRV